MNQINDIETALSAITNGRHSGLKYTEGRISLILDVAGLSGGLASKLLQDCESTCRSFDEVNDVRIIQTAERITQNLIAVASGKGGVGKSTLSTNLAVAMQRAGRKVGLVDADIYGPSQTRLLDAEGIKPESVTKQLIPVMSKYHIPFLSMGQLVKSGQAIAWRGPMAGNALTQLVDGKWGDIKDLILDLPPGTGDVQLSMVQKHKPMGAVIISTPQDLALIDAVRAINFFDAAKVPIIGLVENMSGYICPNCGDVSNPFGSGGAQAAAKQLNIDFLGRIPLDMSIRQLSDAGHPPACDDNIISKNFAAIAEKISAWIDNQ